MDSRAENILFLMVILTGIAAFSGWVATWVFRVAARQRMAENVLRERLARMWSASARPSEPGSH